MMQHRNKVVLKNVLKYEENNEENENRYKTKKAPPLGGA